MPTYTGACTANSFLYIIPIDTLNLIVYNMIWHNKGVKKWKNTNMTA